MTIRIDRCVCTGQSFRALLEIARSRDLTLDQLAKETGACEQCGLCRPYLIKTLQTGRVIFHELIEEDTLRDDREES